MGEVGVGEFSDLDMIYIKNILLKFVMFLKEVSCALQGCIYLIKNIYYYEILLNFKIAVSFLMLKNMIYSCD